MLIEDLMRLPAGHPPSPFNFPLPLQKDGRWGEGRLPDDLELFAVGWLGNSVSTRGQVHADCIDGLYEAYTAGRIFTDGTSGFHNCELCSGDDEWYPNGQVGPVIQWRGGHLRVVGHGHYLLRYDDRVYISPALLLHYILDHEYKPPDEFILATREGEFLAQTDLNWIEHLTS
jgi:hypothetical protein